MTLPGTSVARFFERFPNEDACLDHIFRVRLADGLKCRECDEIGSWRKVKGTKKYYHSCGWQYSPLYRSIFYRSNLSLMAWFYALLLVGNSKRGVRANFLRRQLGIGMKAAHRLGICMRMHIACYDRPERLGGSGKKVYIDEAHIPFVREAGNYSATHAIVMGIACDGIVLCGLIPDRTSQTLLSCIDRFVEPDSIVVTDALKSYNALVSRGWRHIVINHSIAFHDFAGNNNNQIEVYWSVLKRNLHLYRQVGLHNLWLYLAESEFAYNRRNSCRSMFDELMEHFPEMTPDFAEEVKGRFQWCSPQGVGA